MMIRALSEDAPVAVINVDLEGRVQGWNPAADACSAGAGKR
jgi:hypothetical protein